MINKITPPTSLSSKERESSFELLRLVSQFIIVYYHIFYLFISKTYDDPIYEAVQLPLHIGVIVFVLLSGYFSIRATSKGLIKLLSMFIVFTLPETIYYVTNAESVVEVIKHLFILSSSHFWFIKTYLFLFLVSPLLNLYWKESTIKQKWYMTCVLGFVASYMAITKGDSSMLSGKNLVNFAFLYYCGRMLNHYKNKWANLKSLHILFGYVCLNLMLVIGYIYTPHTLQSAIWHLSFKYSSPILLFNSILFFILFGKMHFKSKTINYLASSSLAIYLFHGCRPYVIGTIGQTAYWLHDNITSMPLFFLACALLALTVMTIAIIIDKLLTPIWNQFSKLGVYTYSKLGF